MVTDTHTENIALEHLRGWDHQSARCPICREVRETHEQGVEVANNHTDALARHTYRLVVRTSARAVPPMGVHAAHLFLSGVHADLPFGSPTYNEFVADVYALAAQG